MTDDSTWSLNPHYDEHAELVEAADHLFRLDASACRMARKVAEWFVAADGHAIDDFRALITAILGDEILAQQIVPLAKARQRYQAVVEAEDALFELRCKRLTRQRQATAQVVRLVPPEKDDDPVTDR